MSIARVVTILSLGCAVLLTGPSLAGQSQASAKGKAAKAEKSIPISPAAREEAQKYYATICVTCHGPKGDGDGAGAAALPTKPRKFSDPAWQKSVKNGDIEKVMLEGGPAIGKSPLMPPNPALKDKPEVLAALRDIVRGFAAAK